MAQLRRTIIDGLLKPKSPFYNVVKKLHTLGPKEQTDLLLGLVLDFGCQQQQLLKAAEHWMQSNVETTDIISNIIEHLSDETQITVEGTCGNKPVPEQVENSSLEVL